MYLCTTAWYSPEKLRSISGSLSPSKPKNVSKGISWPSLIYLAPQSGQFLSGKSAPELIEPYKKNYDFLQFGQT